jgi:hypothetical protein
LGFGECVGGGGEGGKGGRGVVGWDALCVCFPSPSRYKHAARSTHTHTPPPPRGTLFFNTGLIMCDSREMTYWNIHQKSTCPPSAGHAHRSPFPCVCYVCVC